VILVIAIRSGSPSRAGGTCTNFALIWREPGSHRTMLVHRLPRNFGGPFATPCKTIDPEPGML